MQLKRCDWRHQKVIESFHGIDYVKKLQKLPLIHLTQQNVKEAMADDTAIVTGSEWVAGIPTARMPWEEFLFFFEQPNELENAMLCHLRIIDELTFQIEYLVGSFDSLENNPTPMISATIRIEPNITDEVDEYYLIGESVRAFNDPQYKGKDFKYLPNVQRQLETSKKAHDWIVNTARVAINQVTRFLKHLEISTLFPVEAYASEKRGGTNRRPALTKKAKAEPWRRMDLPTIRYMNAFPVDPSTQRESLGGKHASPKPHQRAGGRRTLSHERYKKHPMYMIAKAVPFSPSWVGDKEAIVLGTEYRVLSKVDIEAKMLKAKSS